LLALGAKPAKAMNENFEMDVVADQINVIGSGILGLSVGCARCHDHKSDPIPTRDYYALAGIFRSTETLWGAAAHQALTAPQTPLHELQSAATSHARRGGAHHQGQPSAQTARQTQLQIRDRRAARHGRARRQKDRGLQTQHQTASRKSSGAAVPRGFLSACGGGAFADVKQSGRLELAQWLTSPQNPLTARVMVNRVWLQLFGEGLVPTPDDFGVSGERPTHPELLDHLATRFMREGWSIKKLIRSIVLSRTYQLVTQSGDAPLFSHHLRRRLDAETIRDAMLVATGDLNPQPASGSLIQHRDVLINELPSLHQPSTHRSIYLLMLRNSMPPELTPFNLPDATTVVGKRDSSALATQSLYLLNNAFSSSNPAALPKRLLQTPADSDKRIAQAYRHALGRDANASELQRGLDFLREADSMLVSTQTDHLRRELDTWAAFCQALLASNELRYVD
jgi:hypothetical protein